jgi:hypothetical protein
MLDSVSWKDRQVAIFEVFTAVDVKITVFLDLTHCNLVDSCSKVLPPS